MAGVPRIQFSTKRLQIDRANATMVAVIAGAVFVTIFSLVSIKGLWTQRAYQAKVISKKEVARDQLKDNLEARDKLVVSYKEFVGAPTNVLDGNPAGQGERDGDNARVVLDALPSKYDYPALVTSLEKVLNEKNFKIESIVGTDDELAQQQNADNPNPQPVDMPFELTAKGSYSSVIDLIATFERSIRPFTMQKVTFAGNVNEMQIKAEAKTYYQPEKSLKERQEVVK